MKNTIAMVFAGGRVDELSVLTESRPKAAVVLGGCYRTIDFALSNLADTGIGRVGILAQYRPSSLMDHVGSGMAWDLVGTDRQLRFLPPYLGPSGSDWYRGPADALYQNLDFIERSAATDVLVVSGDHAYRMSYDPLLRFHHEHNADLTMAFTPRPDDSNRFGVGELNAVGQIVNFMEKPQYPRANLASMTVYLFRRQVLIDELRRTVAGDPNDATFQVHEVLRRMIPRRRAYGWVHHGPWHYTRTLDEYYQFHLDLLGARPAVDLEAWQIRSNFLGRRSTPPPPVRYLPGAQVDNAWIGPGCVIGGTVRNSVLSPGVRVEPGAAVVDSVLWDDVVVGPDATLDRVISDKRTRFGARASVGEGDTAISDEMPGSLTCGATVIGMDVQVPPGARIGRGCILHPGLTEGDLAEPVAAGASRWPSTAPQEVAS
jgi:glucose-1-phosphate adenylyltransferase